MTRFIVFDKPEETEPVVRLKLEKTTLDGGGVVVQIVDESGKCCKYLLHIRNNGTLYRCLCVNGVAGIQTDADGRIELAE